jgi:hypothetical protein
VKEEQEESVTLSQTDSENHENIPEAGSSLHWLGQMYNQAQAETFIAPEQSGLSFGRP